MRHHDAWSMMPRNVTLCGHTYASGAAWTRGVVVSVQRVTCPACVALLDELAEVGAVRPDGALLLVESVQKVRAVLKARGVITAPELRAHPRADGLDHDGG